MLVLSNLQRSLTDRCLLITFCASTCTVICGCASTTGTPPPSPLLPVPLTIWQQPQNQAVPIGRPATFTVSAYGGDGAFIYQWRRNGNAIPGATAHTYTTSDITDADNGASFDVVVSDSSTSKTSGAAQLTAGPRAPLIGDLRYLLSEQLTGPGVQIVLPIRGMNQLVKTSNAIPTPLSMGWCAPDAGCG